MLGFGPLASRPVAALVGASSGISVSGTLPTLMQVGGFYSTTFSAIGGTAPYSWSATGLPTGLSINASSGVVSGTPTAAGTFSAVVTATDSVLASGSTPTMTVVVVAVPALQRDFPNPPRKRWPADVRTGWIWQTQTALYAAAYSYMASSKFVGYAVLAPPMSSVNASKFVAYAVLQPVPFFIRRDYDLPLPIPPNRWQFIREQWTGPPLPLQTTPYHPFGVQVFPEALRPRLVAKDWVWPTPPVVIPPVFTPPPGAHLFPDRQDRRRPQFMDHAYFPGLMGGEETMISFIWG